MIIIGLTGSIGMGKSTAAAMFRSLGVPVQDSDAAVHAMFAKGGAAVEAVGKAFPEAVKDGAVDRAALGTLVYGDNAALRTLESIVHPLVGKARDAFLADMRARHEPVVVLDIPLLFEAKLDRLCDATVVVSAPRFLQEARVLSRPGMTRERFERILAQQMSDAEKRRRADFVVATGVGRAHSLNRLKQIVRLVRRKGHHARSRS
jgi:dephospho-CoA kinase